MSENKKLPKRLMKKDKGRESPRRGVGKEGPMQHTLKLGCSMDQLALILHTLASGPVASDMSSFYQQNQTQISKSCLNESSGTDSSHKNSVMFQLRTLTCLNPS